MQLADLVGKVKLEEVKMACVYNQVASHSGNVLKRLTLLFYHNTLWLWDEDISEQLHDLFYSPSDNVCLDGSPQELCQYFLFFGLQIGFIRD